MTFHPEDRQLDPTRVDPPKNADKFEIFVCEMVSEIYQIEAQRHGRSGYDQQGVDVFYFDEQKGGTVGFGCREKDQILKQKLTKSEIQQEVELAKKFTPKLIRFVMVATSPRDTELQKEARVLTQKHNKEGLFPVVVWGWEDIKEKLFSKARNTLERYYPEFRKSSDTEPSGEFISAIKKNTDAVTDLTKAVEKGGIFSTKNPDDASQQVRPSRYIPDKKINDVVAKVTLVGKFLGVFGDWGILKLVNVLGEILGYFLNRTGIKEKESISESVYNSKLDSFRDQIKNHNPESALRGIEALKKEIWSHNLSDHVRFRIVTNQAAAKLRTGDIEGGANDYIKALEYKPDDSDALCNAATGYNLIQENEKAKRLIAKVLEKDFSCTRAYSLFVYLHSVDGTKIESIISEIPKAYRESSEVAFAVGDVMRRNGRLRESIKWLELALKNDKEDKIHIKEALGETLLQIAIEDPLLHHGGVPPSKIESYINRSILLFNEVWSTISSTELRKYNARLLVNRSIANRILKNYSAAIRDLEDASEYEPDDPELIRQRALIFYDNNEQGKAIDLLQKHVWDHPERGIPILLASFLEEQGRSDEAISILEKYTGSDISVAPQRDAARYLMILYLKSPDKSQIDQMAKAKKLLQKIYQDKKTTIQQLLDMAKIDRARRDSASAIAKLKEARQLITEQSTPKEMFELADSFYYLNEYQDAAEVYEKVVDSTINTESTQRLLYSYYNTKQWHKVFDITQSLRKKYATQTPKFVFEIEGEVYEELEELDNAKRVFEEYLEENPGDTEVKIRLGGINLRLESYEDLDIFLNGEINYKNLKLPYATRLASLYFHRGMANRALDLMYEIRRLNYNNPEIHLNYMGLFTSADKNLKFPPFNVVQKDFAVEVKDAAGEKKWYILEDREDANKSASELNKNDKLFQLLLGKKVSEKVKLPGGEIANDELTVTAITSKYVRAYQETMAKFNELFPDAIGFQRFFVGEEKDEKGVPKGFQKILDQVSAVNEHQLKVEEFYRKGQITIGLFANFINRDAITVWSGLTMKPDLGIQSSSGTKQERVAAIETLHQEGEKKLVVDLISLLTIHGIGIADDVIKKYGKLGISVSTIEEIKYLITERSGISADGYMTIMKEGDKFFKEEITKEKIEKSVSYYKNMLDWVEKNCDRLSLDFDDKLPKEDSLKEKLGISFSNTILLASKPGRILFSDDERLRSFASHELRVKGVWTQVLLMDMLESKAIDLDKYAEAVVKLLNSHYHHTSISKEVLVYAAKRSEQDTNDPSFDNAIRQLSGKYSDVASSVRVAVEFLYEIWKDSSILEARKELITQKVIAMVIEDRDTLHVDQAAAGLKIYMERIFYLSPIQRSRVYDIIDAVHGGRGLQ